MTQDPTAELLDMVCGFVARYCPGRTPRRLILVLDDGTRIVLPLGPWYLEWLRRQEEKGAGPAHA